MTVTIQSNIQRLRITLRGAVQGVGFRPTVYRLAGKLRLGGWVRNTSAGLELEIEGHSEQLDVFLRHLKLERPRSAVVTTEDILRVAPSGGTSFEILPSEEHVSAGCRTAAVLPDLATCPECLKEMGGPENRRFGYAFTNCTLCARAIAFSLISPTIGPVRRWRSS